MVPEIIFAFDLMTERCDYDEHQFKAKITNSVTETELDGCWAKNGDTAFITIPQIGASLTLPIEHKDEQPAEQPEQPAN